MFGGIKVDGPHEVDKVRDLVGFGLLILETALHPDEVLQGGSILQPGFNHLHIAVAHVLELWSQVHRTAPTLHRSHLVGDCHVILGHLRHRDAGNDGAQRQPE